MTAIHPIASPNFDPQPIDVRFLVLHYTAVDLARTLEIFTHPARKAAAHLVVDVDGAIYECVPCWEGVALRGWHAGVSHWHDGSTRWEALNDWSIGVEIVNFNGNVFPFTDAQYRALARVVEHLRGCYPALAQAEAVLSHEQIAGFRGKADPGWCFDWPRFFAMCYPDQPAPARAPICPPALRDALARLAKVAPAHGSGANAFWERVSLLTEAAVAATATPAPPSSERAQRCPIPRPLRRE
ncbi:N-acetylmuramoyl-L-alanine amidase [Caldilinea sp.]|uniref:N-acetylmuramoyl-L-alanine amidase n=1 Tax=Caldilinea sp. TaxID=2293560 RepID=UPI002CC6D724|nr:N-acetylmuramoyl-L-alanine amidase [Anaerolineales bacterium]HQY93194.1 N-acetylmuramoyl-L-alanine amidase [Caldilinea sp.]HRA66612.1 N-acetylmuramoyl-L-alanine amidase [Caldilinea sp.]